MLTIAGLAVEVLRDEVDRGIVTNIGIQGCVGFYYF